MDEPKPRDLARQILPAEYLDLHGLAGLGLTPRTVAKEVAAGRLIRLRKGRYASTELHEDLMRAGELGARLDCVSLLAAIGIFVGSSDGFHVHVERGASRIPAPAPEVVRHWRRSSCTRRALAADIREALAQAVRCQSQSDAVATLDSAWHHGIIDESDIAQIFAMLPLQYQGIRGLLDRRAESGTETLMRLLLRTLGCDIDVQVWISGVGRVDFVVDGWLIVECDSKAYHEGWKKQKLDRRRDIAAAALGYTTVRPLAEDILYDPDAVLAVMKAILAHPPRRRPVRNSSTPHARRRSRRRIGGDRRGSEELRPAGAQRHARRR